MRDTRLKDYLNLSALPDLPLAANNLDAAIMTTFIHLGMDASHFTSSWAG